MAPSKRGWEMIIIVSVLVGLATVAACLRVVARVKLRVKFQMDDYLCCVGMVFLYGMLIELILWCAIGGNGTHFDELDPETILNFGKIFLANQFTYFILSPVIKISIVCFYQRIFTTPKFHLVSSGVNYLIGLWGAAIFLACALQCRPLRGYWDKSVQAKCFDGNTFFIVNQIFNVVMDFVILGLPLPIIWSLKRAWQDKLALSGIFALGGFVCFASIYRIVVLFYIDPTDTTFTVYQATLWTHIEPTIGMICSCLPTIRGLFPAYNFSTWRTGNSHSSRNHYGSSSKLGNPASAPHSRSSVYIKMSDAIAYRSETSDEERLVIEGEMERDRKDGGVGKGGIMVRTDVRVVQDDKSGSLDFRS